MDKKYEKKVYEASYYISKYSVNYNPDTAIMLGSGFGKLSERLEDRTEISYADVPNFPVSTAPGHAGKLIFGRISGKDVICLSGRFHYYEGYDFPELAFPVMVLKALGVRILIMTNAAGAINQSYKPGDVMIISDHIKLMGHSPLRGQNDPDLGTRFPDMSRAYDPELRKLAVECAAAAGLGVHEGVYFYFEGPQFETPAEIRAARVLGGDAAGMSTAPEAIAASYASLRVLGISFMSNMAAGVLDKPITGEEVNAAAEKASPLLEKFITDLIGRI
jgi:purine-nucleoside phosphorylase